MFPWLCLLQLFVTRKLEIDLSSFVHNTLPAACTDLKKKKTKQKKTKFFLTPIVPVICLHVLLLQLCLLYAYMYFLLQLCLLYAYMWCLTTRSIFIVFLQKLPCHRLCTARSIFVIPIWSACVCITVSKFSSRFLPSSSLMVILIWFACAFIKLLITLSALSVNFSQSDMICLRMYHIFHHIFCFNHDLFKRLSCYNLDWSRWRWL